MHLHRLWNAVRTLLGLPLLRAHPTYPVTEQLRQHLDTLTARVDDIARKEAIRAAEHLAALDALNRLYKRVSARIAREHKPETEASESVMTLRNRLGR